MGKKTWFIVLMLLTLLSEGRQAQAPNQFTPVVVSPFTSKTQPVLGTDGQYHAVYELAFTNTRPETATLKKIAVLDASDASPVIATYEGDALLGRLRTLGNTAAGNPDIAFNGTRLFLLHLSFDSRDAIPPRLRHHLDLLGPTGPGDPTIIPLSYTGAPFELGRPRVPVLGPPLAGKGWVALNGCCEADRGHRTTVLPVNGQLYFAQRYAIDWMRLDDQGRFVHGDPSDVRNYTAYGADVLAVANGTAVDTLNTLDDQVPPNDPDPRTITVQTVLGNHIVLAIGDGLFAFFAHLQKGSVTVKPGDQVKRGQVLGKVGNTGNASAPHLHFHLVDGASAIGSNGLPYVIDRFELAGQLPAEQFAHAASLEGDWSQGRFAQPLRRHEQFPLDLVIVNFTP